MMFSETYLTQKISLTQHRVNTFFNCIKKFPFLHVVAKEVNCYNSTAQTLPSFEINSLFSTVMYLKLATRRENKVSIEVFILVMEFKKLFEKFTCEACNWCTLRRSRWWTFKKFHRKSSLKNFEGKRNVFGIYHVPFTETGIKINWGSFRSRKVLSFRRDKLLKTAGCTYESCWQWQFIVPKILALGKVAES